ncbi:hypothetical protein LCER1_G007912 [Lachnellula cervina]|uniref:DUF7871 domain-containing protein n=1 Tax=Lachnellula cervina TaxID=1316786 RepID=A0A7D8YMG1_9HELO|nr:hypothetical protein LCER1_G007912 [Lachnellula cervina]
MVTPSTCCGKSGEGCVCASQAKCSCGEKSALHCSCDKSATENKVLVPLANVPATDPAPRTRPRAAACALAVPVKLVSLNHRIGGSENILTVITAACTCEKASDGGLLPTETDFTTS